MPQAVEARSCCVWCSVRGAPQAVGRSDRNVQRGGAASPLDLQTTTLNAHLQALETALISAQPADPQGLISVGTQQELGSLGHENPHLRFLGGHRRPWLTSQSHHCQRQGECRCEGNPTGGEVQGQHGVRWALSVPRPADRS